MGLFGTIGSVGGGIVGNMIAPGYGGIIGASLGGALGNSLDPETGMPNNPVNPGAVQGQNQLVQQLQATANGTGPNPAIGMMKKANDENIRQNAGFVASQKGINPALASRLAAQNQAMMSQKNAADMGIMQANQQIQAQGQLANIYSGQQNVNLENQRMQLQNQQLNNQRNTQMFGGLLNGMGAFAGQKYMMDNYDKNGNPRDAGQAGADEGSLGGSYGQRPMNLSQGGPVPGKAEVMGNHPKNDTVPAMLSPGEIVIPRTHAKNPEMAKRFIDNVLKNHKVHAKQKQIDEIDVAEVMKVNTQLKKRVAQLEKKVGK